MKHLVTSLISSLLILMLGCLYDEEEKKPPYLVPANVYATQGTLPTQIVITWDAAIYAESYYIYRTGSIVYVVSNIGNTTELTFTDTDVKDGYYYYYQVQAYCNDKGYSEYSQMVKGYTTKVGDTWASLSSLAAFSPRDSYNSIVFDDKIWIIGGYDGDFVQSYENETSFIPSTFKNDIWYSPDAVNWYIATQHPIFEFRSNYASASCVFDNKIWITGGRQVDNYYNDDVWNSADGINWSRVTNTSGFSGRVGHKMVAFNGYMWVVGGYDGNTNAGFKSDVWRSTNGVNWECVTADTGFSGRCLFGMLVFDGKMWVIGGHYTTYIVRGSVSNPIIVEMNHKNAEVWSSSDGVNWTLETANPGFMPRSGHASAVHNGRMWISGGWYSTNGFQVLPVNNVGDETNLTYPDPAGLPHWDQLHETVTEYPYHDGDTTRVSTEGGVVGGTYRDLYNLDDSVPIVYSTEITGVRVFWNLRRSGTDANARGTIKTNGAVIETTNLNPPISIYRGYGQTWTTNPVTGLDWTWADIDNLQAGVTLVKGVEGSDAYCTQVAVEVYYDIIYIIPQVSGVLPDAWSSADGINWVEETPNDDVKPRSAHGMVSFHDKLIMFTGVAAGSYAYDIWYR